ncbi:MAG: ribonuclease P protein component [Bacilli bacterium]|nr:ribonuclease P protein component [Bacilli bacterium]
MKREYRVRKHSDFDRIIQGGRKIKSSHFNLYFLPATGNETHGYIGIAISKANGNAVTRVREKRQVRAILAKSGFEKEKVYLIVVIRPSYDPGTYHENESELLEKLELIKKDYLN